MSHKPIPPQLLPLVREFESAEQQLAAMRLAAKAITEDVIALLSEAKPEDIEFARSAMATLLIAGARGQQAFDRQPITNDVWCKGSKAVEH